MIIFSFLLLGETRKGFLYDCSILFKFKSEPKRKEAMGGCYEKGHISSLFF
ncbi:MAG: hypothetical protein ABIK81_03425 [candidate division WOR-3 bacterium]